MNFVQVWARAKCNKAILNNEKMLEFLLECGAHPNIVDFKGRTALMRAAELGHAQAPVSYTHLTLPTILRV